MAEPGALLLNQRMAPAAGTHGTELYRRSAKHALNVGRKKERSDCMNDTCVLQLLARPDACAIPAQVA